MGDIAEMHIDGTLCECCGEYLGEAVGYPRYCNECKRDREGEEANRRLSNKTHIDYIGEGGE